MKVNHNHKPCLILNIDYMPLGIISWQKAIVLSYRQKKQECMIKVIDYYDNDFVKGIDYEYKLPAVIQASKYVKFNTEFVNFSRKNLFIRDNFTCQYCGKKLHQNQLTYDHVIPKSQWKKDSTATCWSNILTACYGCNSKKANKTPQQANMKMLSKPIVPTIQTKYLPVTYQLHSIDMPTLWSFYLPKSLLES